MARKAPSAEALKILYSLSGNECAFPECDHPIFNDSGLYIAELCHINAANVGGQRYEEKQSDEDRRSRNNLLFFCHRHHKETDNVEVYPPESLFKMKEQHEIKFTEKGRELSQLMYKQVIIESKVFWQKQAEKTFELWDLKIDRDFELGVFDIINELIEHIEKLRYYCDRCAESDDSQTLKNDLIDLLKKAGLDYRKLENVPYYNSPFENRNWEMHNIGRPNFFSQISLTINQLKVKVAEELLKFQPKNEELKLLAVKFRKDFEDDFDNSYYVD